LAVYRAHAGDSKAAASLRYLQAATPATIDDPYVLALVANALLALDPGGTAAGPYVDRLAAKARISSESGLASWGPAESRRTLFCGGGTAAALETTALASLALLGADRHGETTRGALAWLITQRDAQGTWFSTQATVLALKALLAGTDAPLDDGRPRRITIALDGNSARELVIPVDQSDVVQQVDFSDGLGPGTHRLTLDDRGGSGSGYQVVVSYHEPDLGLPKSPPVEPLTIGIAYDRTTLDVDDRIAATATVINHQVGPAPMVILDLPIPAGFALQDDDLAAEVASGRLARFQLTPRSAVVYLCVLQPSRPFQLRYHLRATMPVKITVPPARVFEYYDPDRRGSSPPALLTVRPRR
jgi:hypothetical protein